MKYFNNPLVSFSRLITFFISILFLCSFQIYSQSNGNYTKYVTVSGSGNHDGSSLSNAMTLDEAKSAVVAGDYIFVQKGVYQRPQQTTSFSKDGTASNPIIWEGEITNADLKNALDVSDVPSLNGDDVNSTVIATDIAANYQISMGGDYNIFRKIVFREEASGRGLGQINGNYVTLDSCASKYPSNGSSSSNHTWMVYGQHVTFKYSSFYNGSRCIIWVRKNSGAGADNFTMEFTKLYHASNHPPIQIMPTTNSSDPTTIKHPIVRNCVFLDNPYSDGIYSRHNEQMAFYNNLFINSSTPFSVDIHTGIYDTCNTKGGIIAFNTIIESSGNIIYDVAENQINFMNNLVYRTSAPSGLPYRYDSQYNPIYRHHNDYNLWYSTSGNIGSMDCDLGSYNSTTLDNIFSAYGFEEHSLIQVQPEFVDYSNYDLRPVDQTSPQVGAGTPITTANGYWMDITTDFFGNPRDPANPTVGAIEYATQGPDVTAPRVIGAALTDSVTLKVSFSESLDQASAQNQNNYSINNGIQVLGASLSGSVVTLNTSVHSPNTYTVTVSDVTDLAGNVVNPDFNSAQYVMETTTPVELVSFTGSVNEAGDVELSWITATEMNNQGFDIERREGQGPFNTIGSIDGNGTTTEIHRYTYSDNSVENKTYFYRLKQIDYNGQFNYSNEIEIEVNLPVEFVLAQNYPNPFNPSTTINYSTPNNSFVSLKVYNILGTEIATLVSKEQTAGKFDVIFNASSLPSGIYFFRLEASDPLSHSRNLYVDTKKMTLIK